MLWLFYCRVYNRADLLMDYLINDVNNKSEQELKGNSESYLCADL